MTGFRGDTAIERLCHFEQSKGLSGLSVVNIGPVQMPGFRLQKPYSHGNIGLTHPVDTSPGDPFVRIGHRDHDP